MYETMSIFQLIAVAVLGTALALTIRPFRPEMAMLVGIVTGLILLGYGLAELSGLVETLRTLSASYGVDGSYVGVLLKIIGIAYAAQFGSQVCMDAGESAIAGKVELCGRVLILAAALPAVVLALSGAVSLLNGFS